MCARRADNAVVIRAFVPRERDARENETRRVASDSAIDAMSTVVLAPSLLRKMIIHLAR